MFNLIKFLFVIMNFFSSKKTDKSNIETKGSNIIDSLKINKYYYYCLDNCKEDLRTLKNRNL